MPQLDYSSYLGQVSWLAFCFLLLYCFVRFAFIPRLERILNAGSEEVRVNVEAAEKLLAEAQAMRGKLEVELAQVREEARVMVFKAEEDIKRMLERAFVESEAKAAHVLQAESERLSAWYEDRARDALPTLVEDVAPAVTKTLLEDFPIRAEVTWA